MGLSTLLFFLPACFALNLAPGPNNLLSLNNATRYGFRLASLAGLGRLFAFAIMIALSAFGLAIVLQTSALFFYAVKICGALYLLYLAFQLWRAKPADMGEGAIIKANNLCSLMQQEFFVAAGNPKAILIFTAFLPQFVDLTQPTDIQFLILGSLFLTLEIFAILIYAYVGVYLQRWFKQAAHQKIFNRVCASLLGLASLGLLTAKRS